MLLAPAKRSLSTQWQMLQINDVIYEKSKLETNGKFAQKKYII